MFHFNAQLCMQLQRIRSETSEFSAKARREDLGAEYKKKFILFEFEQLYACEFSGLFPKDTQTTSFASCYGV